MVEVNWEELIEKKRARRDALIPEDWRLPTAITSKVSQDSTASAFDLLSEAALLTEREIDITENYTATSITAKIATGELSSYDVAAAFCKRAAIVHQLVRSLCTKQLFYGRGGRVPLRWTAVADLYDSPDKLAHGDIL
jgi:amidase